MAGSALQWGWVVWLAVAVAMAVGLIDGPRRYRTLVVAPRPAVAEPIWGP